jgi:hypothetical protein
VDMRPVFCCKLTVHGKGQPLHHNCSTRVPAVASASR